MHLNCRPGIVVCSLLPGLAEPSQVKVIAVLADYPGDKVRPTILQAAGWGYDGLEIACWDDHMDVRKAAIDRAYVKKKRQVLQWVQIDLGASYALHAILVWHYHSQPRVYRGVVVQASDDRDFLKGVVTVFNNDHDNSSGLGIGKDKEYIEVAEGRPIDPKGVKGRYVRLYSDGNTSNDLNYYVEVEVYGTPSK